MVNHMKIAKNHFWEVLPPKKSSLASWFFSPSGLGQGLVGRPRVYKWGGFRLPKEDVCEKVAMPSPRATGWGETGKSFLAFFCVFRFLFGKICASCVIFLLGNFLSFAGNFFHLEKFRILAWFFPRTHFSQICHFSIFFWLTNCAILESGSSQIPSKYIKIWLHDACRRWNSTQSSLAEKCTK